MRSDDQRSRHTIETLTKDVNDFKKYVRSEFTKMQPQVQEMHDFILDARGFERGKSNRNTDGSININKDVWGLILKLVGIIAVLAGIKLLT